MGRHSGTLDAKDQADRQVRTRPAVRLERSGWSDPAGTLKASANNARLIPARDLSGATLHVDCDAVKARAHSVADELGAVDAATDATATILRPYVDAASIQSLRTGSRVMISLQEKPDLYC